MADTKPPSWWAEEIRVLSLTQPWATLTAVRNAGTGLPVKWVETRSWKTKYVGPVAIAATARIPKLPRRATLTVGDYEVTNDTLRGCSKFPQYMMRSEELGWPYRLPLSCIVAVAQLVACVPMVDEDEWDGASDAIVMMDNRLVLWRRVADSALPVMAPVDISDQHPYGFFEPGRYGWLLADTVRLRNTIPHSGDLGLRKASPELLDRLKVAS